MTTARSLAKICTEAGPHYQLHINEYIDDFRRANSDERERMVAEGPEVSGRLEGLVAAVTSALCRETETTAPEWLKIIHSPEPFFVIPAKSFALRVRLMLESPPAFRIRNVFVSENYLSRA